MFTSDNEVGEVARRQSLELLEFVWYSRISRKSCGWWMDVHKIFGSGNYWDKEQSIIWTRPNLDWKSPKQKIKKWEILEIPGIPTENSGMVDSQ